MERAANATSSLLPRRRSLAVALLCAAACSVFVAALYSTAPARVYAAAPVASPAVVIQVAPLDHPDAVCASCHKAVYDRYERTQMARGSGLATDGLIPGSYHHPQSNVDYSIFLRDGSAWMSYKRDPSDPRGALSGERRLEYYIGSAAQGRTYLYQINHQWFELPINFYAQRNGWEMAPALASATHMPAPLPADPNCLFCHTTDVQPSEITARNRYAAAPFRQGGVGCSACHGDPSAHLAQHGHAPIANPAKFAPAQRDSTCIQCHLEGDAVVYRPGRSLSQFVPGDKLSDFAVYFVKASQATGGSRAVSQYEALLQSACKRASGDKLTCTTCHDPHYDPSPAERVQYFRTRCLTCHTNPQMASHHPEQPDCATCHMPARITTDISHAQVTDHNIESRPATPSAPALLDTAADYDLVPVGAFPAGDREFGLAYAQLAQRGLPGAQQKALALLTKVANSGQSDHELEAQLGYLLQISGNTAQARTAYDAALNADPYDPTALANLAVLDASSNHVPEAIHLLDRLIHADPSQTAAGLNLAFIDCTLGRRSEALAVLELLAAVNSDDPQLRDFLHHETYAGQHCDLSSQPATTSAFRSQLLSRPQLSPSR